MLYYPATHKAFEDIYGFWSGTSYQRRLVKSDEPFSNMAIIFLINTLAI